MRYILEVKTCSLPTGIGSDGSLLSDWSEAVTIDLYKDSILPWYERTYDNGNELFEFVDDGKNIRIKFLQQQRLYKNN